MLLNAPVPSLNLPIGSSRSGLSLVRTMARCCMATISVRWRVLRFIDSLPDKLAHLKTEHGMAVDSVLERQLLSINNARNCLVHRRGIISQRDLNSDDTMRVEWRKLHIFLQNQDGEHDLVIGQIVEKESAICLRVKDEQKRSVSGSASCSLHKSLLTSHGAVRIRQRPCKTGVVSKPRQGTGSAGGHSGIARR